MSTNNRFRKPKTHLMMEKEVTPIRDSNLNKQNFKQVVVQKSSR